MAQGEPVGVEGDAGWERQPRAVAAIAHDRTAASGELLPELVAAAGRWNELDEGNLPEPSRDAGPDVGGPWRGGFGSRRLVLRMAFHEVVPIDPLSERRREPALDHGEVFLVHGTFPELRGQGGRGRR